MPDMHPTMQRLYEAMRSRGASTQTQIAGLLNTSPQRVKNWEVRGLSLDGAIEAQRDLGINAVWLLDGTGSQDLAASQLTRPTPENIVAAARMASAALIDPHPLDPSDPTDAELLSLALESVLEEGIVEATDSDALRFVQRFHRREVSDGNRGSDRADGGTGGHARKEEAWREGRVAAGNKR